MLTDIFAISCTMSLLIIALAAFSPLIEKRWRAKCKYFAWLFIAVRLIIPARFDFTYAPIHLPSPEHLYISDIAETSDTAANVESDASHESFSDKNHSELNRTEKYISIVALSYAVWFIGAVSFFLFHILSLVFFRHRIRSCITEIGDGIYICGKISNPMMTGFFRPTILIPDCDISDKELELILLHEKAHFKRKDTWYKLLMLIACSMHWFNPFVHLMSRQANRDLEYSCDDFVTKEMSTEEKKLYSLTILRFMGDRHEYSKAL